MSESKVREMLELAKRNIREVKIGDEVMKLKDCMGNELAIGNMIQINGEWHHLLATIVEYHSGGILVGSAYGKEVPQGQTPSRLRLLIDMTLSIQPGVSTIANSYRIPNPQAGEVVIKTENKSKPD